MEIEAVIDEEAFGRIQLGFTPQDTQDKWAIRLEEGNWLRCYRAWTGYCIYEAQLVWDESAAGYTIPSAWANRHPDQYRNTDVVYDARTFIYLIRRLLLGHAVPLPTPTNLSHRHKLVHEKHVMGGGENERPSIIPLDLL
jgi:hypothetical protein